MQQNELSQKISIPDIGVACPVPKNEIQNVVNYGGEQSAREIPSRFRLSHQPIALLKGQPLVAAQIVLLLANGDEPTVGTYKPSDF